MSLPRMKLSMLITATLMFLLSVVMPLIAVSTSHVYQGQGGWRVDTKQGDQVRSTLTITNRCAEPHYFRVINKLKYVRFERPVDRVLIAPGASDVLPVLFDSTNLKPQKRSDKVIVQCLDCKKERRCLQDKDVVPVEMSVSSATPSGWCVIPGYSRGIPMKCVVKSVYASKSPKPCPEESIPAPSGVPLPKVGSEVAYRYCDRPGPRRTIDTDPNLRVTTPPPSPSP